MIRKPTNKELALFMGAVGKPEKKGSWIFLFFNGSGMSGVRFEFSKIWALYVTGDIKFSELDVVEQIRRKLKPTEKMLKVYVVSGICKKMNVGYQDWIEAAASKGKDILGKLEYDSNCRVILVAENKLWSLTKRMSGLVAGMGLKEENQPYGLIASDIIKKGHSVPYENNASVDGDYYVQMIAKNRKKLEIVKENLFKKGFKLKLNAKNKSSTFRITPMKEKDYCDLVLTRKDGDNEKVIFVTTVWPKNPHAEFYFHFSFPSESIQCNVTNIKKSEVKGPIDLKANKIRIKERYQPLQIMALLEETMPEALLSSAKDFLNRLFIKISGAREDTRFALMGYGDYESKDALTTTFSKAFITMEHLQKYISNLVPKEPSDFMAAVDCGLSSTISFPWDTLAQKHLILIFFSPPHPSVEPKRDFYSNLSYQKAQRDWCDQLKHLNNQGIHIISVYLPKERKEKKGKQIESEVECFCKQLAQLSYFQIGTTNDEKIVEEIVNMSEIQWDLIPSNFSLPILEG